MIGCVLRSPRHQHADLPHAYAFQCGRKEFTQARAVGAQGSERAPPS